MTDNLIKQLNLSMHGNQHNIFSIRDKIEAMKMKRRTWIRRNVSKLFSNDNCEFDIEHTNYLIQCHLQKLIEKFDKYFPNNEIDSRKLWIRDPLTTGYYQFIADRPRSLFPYTRME